MNSILTSVFSSWAEIHGALMGIAFGLLAAASSRELRSRQWLLIPGFIAGLIIGLNLNVSPWEGWWHAWYILLPFAGIVYLLCR